MAYSVHDAGGHVRFFEEEAEAMVYYDLLSEDRLNQFIGWVGMLHGERLHCYNGWESGDVLQACLRQLERLREADA